MSDSPEGSEPSSLRELVLQAGLDVVAEDGVELGPESISYAKVFAYLEAEYGVRVTRASVHERIWPSHDDFRRDVLAAAVSAFPPAVRARGDGSGSALKVLAGHSTRPGAPKGDPVRPVGSAIWQQTLDSAAYRHFQATKAVALRYRDGSGDDALHRAIAERADQRLARRRSRSLQLLKSLGLKLKPELVAYEEAVSDLLHIAIGTLLVGGHLHVHSGYESINRPLLIKGEPEDMERPSTAFSFGMQALFHLFAEPDPTLTPGPLVLQGIAAAAGPDSRPAEGPSQLIGEGRRTREQLKRLVIAAGVELLLRDGLSLRPLSLSYTTVFEHVRERHGLVVNRASIHPRFWSSHDDFCLEVLAGDVRRDPPNVLATPDSEVRAPARDDPPEIRTHRATRYLQHTIEAQLDVLIDSALYRRRLLIKAAVPDLVDGAHRDRLVQAILTAEQKRATWRSRLLADGLAAAGLAVRPETGLSDEDAIDVFERIGTAMATGVAFDHLAGVGTVRRRYELPVPGSDDSTEEWTPAGIVGRAMIELLYRPI